MISKQTTLQLQSYWAPRASLRDHLESLGKITPVWTKILVLEHRHTNSDEQFAKQLSLYAWILFFPILWSQSRSILWGWSLSTKGNAKSRKRWFSPETKVIFVENLARKQLHILYAMFTSQRKDTSNQRKTNTCFLGFFFFFFKMSDPLGVWLQASWVIMHLGQRIWLGQSDRVWCPDFLSEDH